MKPDPQFFLKDHLSAKDVEHSGASLYDHLCNVEKILRICRCDDATCLAGLYHSIYGTSVFKHQTTNDRELIKSVIGERAEFLAWIFCNAKRPFCWFFGPHIPFEDGSFIRVDQKTLHDLHMIEGANMLEQHGGLVEIMSFASRTDSGAARVGPLP